MNTQRIPVIVGRAGVGTADLDFGDSRPKRPGMHRAGWPEQPDGNRDEGQGNAE